MEKFFVSHSPFIRSKLDTNKMFLYVSLALVVPAIFGITFFGIRALFVIALSLGTCFVSECLYNFIKKLRFFVDDFSFFVSGLTLALLMPVNVPYYALMLSGFISVFVTKMAFGGLGRNDLNPALVGRCFAGMICPTMSAELFAFSSGANTYLSIFSGATYTLTEVLSGKVAGAIGTTCALVIAACYIFLACTKTIDFKIPLISVLAFFLVGLALWDLETLAIELCSCSFLFISVFMLTDPNTSADSFLGKFLTAALFGALSPLLIKNASLGENSLFFLALLTNLLVPFINKLFSWRPIQMGGIRNAHKN